MSRMQAAAGIVPPDFLCDRTSSQLGDLANDGGGQSGLVQALTTRAAAAGIRGDWERRAAALVDGPIRSSLERQKAYMLDLRSRAGATAGVGARPRGAAFYEMALRFHLTTAHSPAEVHRIGLEQVAAIQREAGALMDRLGYPAGPTVARMNALAKDPAQLFPNTDAGREALLAFVRERTDDVKRRLPPSRAHRERRWRCVAWPSLPSSARRLPPPCRAASTEPGPERSTSTWRR